MAKPALGRGLGALLGGAPAKPAPIPAGHLPAPAAETSSTVRQVPLDRIRPCTLQPRKEFKAEALEELAESIRQQASSSRWWFGKWRGIWSSLPENGAGERPRWPG